MKNPELLAVIKPVIECMEKNSIPHYIGGSIASSIYGIARATMDVDIAAAITEKHIPALIKFLSTDYYIDENMIREAIKNESSFNVIHFQTVFKIDIFVYRENLFQINAIKRSVQKVFDKHDPATLFHFSTLEDTVLNKLLCFKKGGKVSERQWHDVIGMLKVQGSSFDRTYLQKWAQKLELFPLLNKAYQEAGVDK